MGTKKRMYGVNNAFGRRLPENTALCIKEVFGGFYSHQCTRKRRYGKGKLWCKIHDPDYIKKKDKASQKEYDGKYKIWKEKNRRACLIEKLCGHISTNKLHMYKLTLKKRFRLSFS